VDADAILAEADRKMYANKRRNKAIAVSLAEPMKPHHGPEKAAQGCLDLLSVSVGASRDNNGTVEAIPAVSVH
jgi:hypothetical protein